MRRVAVGRRNLLSERRKAVLGISGVAIALVMVFAFNGLYTGAVRQLTRYIDTSPADVFVAQSGVRNMHMASSSIPLSELDRIRSTPGVTSADPILYRPASLGAGSATQLSYLIGFREEAIGGPIALVDGSLPGPGQIVLDERAADGLGVGLGDPIEALGRSWTISGMTSGLTNLANTLSFVRYDDLAVAIEAPATASYVLVETQGSTDEIAGHIEQATGLSALSRTRFSQEETDLAKDMVARIIRVMNVSAFLIGIAVVCLTLYVATLARLREVGIMRALGAGRGRLVVIVLSQAAWTVALAGGLAVLLAAVLGGVLDRMGGNVSLVLSPATVTRVAIEAVVLGLVGAVFPLFKTWRVDPATVFRRST